ncbi:hypothetical protein Cgig2_006273 [Carnegiea gigantea]|uniref:Transposase n=1 Tax=Carnegiea gigantea TaxID=171969 RepID=A0A9Q1K0L9_9CARY|nr:hypothetical protein Cgig2_006273 [Carnegiea gigantea]
MEGLSDPSTIYVIFLGDEEEEEEEEEFADEDDTEVEDDVELEDVGEKPYQEKVSFHFYFFSRDFRIYPFTYHCPYHRSHPKFHPTSSPPFHNHALPNTRLSTIQPTHLSFGHVPTSTTTPTGIPTPITTPETSQPSQEVSQPIKDVQQQTKTKIFPRGKEFYPNHTHVIHALSNIMRSKFDSSYHTWKEIPIEVRNIWFDEFKKKFCWDVEHAHEIRRVFEFRGSSRLKGMTFEIQKSGKQPVWLSKDVYDGLCAYWESEEFKRKSMLGKTNRASPLGVGSSVHCGGSIRYSEHRRRLAEKLQREPTIDESFALTHSRTKDQSFVDQKSKKEYEKYKTRLLEIQASTQGEGSTSQGTPHPQLSMETQMTIWKEAVGLTKKAIKEKLKKRLHRVEKKLSETTKLVKTLMQQMNFTIPISTNVGVGNSGIGSTSGSNGEDEDEDEDDDDDDDDDDDNNDDQQENEDADKNDK